MKFIKTEIPDVVLCKPTVFNDERGYFFESFKKDEFENFIGYSVNFCQDNEAKSTKGVLRGLHYQLPPFAQAKLVRVVKGSVLDIVVDIRKKSPTYGKHIAVEISEENKYQLFIPKGFAHGYVVLSNEAIFTYKVDNYYNRETERGIIYNDNFLGIDWKLPANKLIISAKDKQQPLFKNADVFENNKMY
ncbi:dTDP-4-dehydrorhamnose 3,5-epimerase [Lutibacter sp.]|uniref:dTDP-4-dehydrorhamnose 3,5-epimerase n=1 Tax=Lutibacter sp. TaxID=1925666 RepID=UPI0025BE0E82|nr:dTDP-4-dehydrorhamnose 3,5-epimerase [Lutibacter sp.]MCF6168498.1 dTDP-4-dehydrorhamnose 3,5-epimerase [Lutibacter sp.]